MVPQQSVAKQYVFERTVEQSGAKHCVFERPVTPEQPIQAPSASEGAVSSDLSTGAVFLESEVMENPKCLRQSIFHIYISYIHIHAYIYIYIHICMCIHIHAYVIYARLC